MPDYWDAPSKRQMEEMVHFTKNMALLRLRAPQALLGMEEPWPVSVPVDRPTRLEKAVHLTKRLAA